MNYDTSAFTTLFAKPDEQVLNISAAASSKVANSESNLHTRHFLPISF